MAKVKSVPQVFKTSDGEEYESKGEAERHQAVLDAMEEAEKVRYKLCRATIKTYKTADGQPFDFRSWNKFFYIQHWHGFPMMGEVELAGYYWTDFAMSNGELQIVESKHNEKSRHWDVGDLYADKREAQKALLKAQEEQLAEYQQRVDKLRAEIGE